MVAMKGKRWWLRERGVGMLLQCRVVKSGNAKNHSPLFAKIVYYCKSITCRVVNRGVDKFFEKK